MDDNTLRQFIGPNADYYLKQWQATDYGGRTYTWNWAAFVFSIFWCSYRKMYGAATFFSVLALLMVILQCIFLPLIVYRMIMLAAIAASLGYFGNSMYRRHVQQSLDQIYTFNPDEQQLRGLFISLGGIDVLAACLNLLFMIIALYIILMIFDVLPEKWQLVHYISQGIEALRHSGSS